MKNILSAFCLLFAFGVLMAQQTSSPIRDVPHTISYQGLLTDSVGQPLPNVPHTIVVRLYGASNGTQPVWQDTFDVATDNGVFNLLLGGGNVALPGGDTLAQPLWLGIQLAGGEEMRPLTQLTASPYALGVADSTISTRKLRDNSVTAEKMGTNYVAGVSVNGNLVSSKGSIVNIISADSSVLWFDQRTNSLVFGQAAAQQGESTGATTQSLSVKSVTGEAPVTTSTSGSSVTVGLQHAGSGQIVIGQGTTKASQFKALSGDVSLSASGATTVNKINGAALGSTTPTDDHILIANGSEWNSTKMSGDATLEATGVLTLANTNVNAGKYGDSAHIPTFTVDSKGRLTAASTVTLKSSDGASGPAGGDLSGTYPKPTVSAINGAALGTTTPTYKNILVADGSKWNSVSVSGDASITSSGLLLLDQSATTGNNIVSDVNLATTTINGGAIGHDSTLAVSSNQLGINLAHANTWTAGGTQFGDGTSRQQVIINGMKDATSADDLTTNPGKWDLAVYGDIAATGIIKSSAGITIDGTGPLHTISADQPLQVSTSNGDLTLSAMKNINITAGNPGGSVMITGLGTGVVQSTNDVLSAGPIQTSAIAPGANNTFLTTDNNGVAGFNALSVDGATLKGDGSGTPLAMNLAHANNWDANSTMFGDSTSNQQVIINGVADAASGDDPTASTWDLAVTGDMEASGIIRSGTGITIDGNNSMIFSSQPLTISTPKYANTSLTLSPSGKLILNPSNAIELFSNMDMNGNSISNVYRIDGGGLGVILGDGEPIAITNLGTGVVKVFGDVLSSGQVDLTSDVTNILPAQNGGTGVDGSAAANGAVLIGNGSGYTLSNLTAGNNVSITNSAGGITIAASSRTAVSAAYTALSTDYILGVTVSGVTVTLPSAASVTAGKMFIVKDESGGAAVSNITITPAAGETIDGAGGNATISTNYGTLKIYSDGTNWFTF